MKYFCNFVLVLVGVLALVSCDEKDTSSFPPTFKDMVFVSEAGVAATEVKTGEKLTVILEIKEGGQNVTNPNIRWKIGGMDVKPEQTMIHQATLKVPAELEAGEAVIEAYIIYGVAGQSSRQMSDYRTETGLNVSYKQNWAGVVGHYELSCTKKINIVAPSDNVE